MYRSSRLIAAPILVEHGVALGCPSNGDVGLMSDDVLEHGPSATTVVPSQRAGGPNRRWLIPLTVGTAVTLGVAGAGIALGVMLSGGGTQPEELVPSDALAYVDVDFDPPAGQKANLIRLLDQFPELSGQFNGDDDLKAQIVKAMVGENYRPSEVMSWLGDRMGIAVVHGDTDKSAGLEVIVQVTDEAAARKTLQSSLQPDQLAFESGYAIVTSDQLDLGGSSGFPSSHRFNAADVASAALAAPLSQDPKFTNVIDPLGDGVASFYYDVDAAHALIKELASSPLLAGQLGALDASTTTGQLGMMLRINSGDIELVGRSSDSAMATASAPSLFTKLPQDTAAALYVTGGAERVKQQWSDFLEQLPSAELLSGLGNAQGRYRDYAVTSSLSESSQSGAGWTGSPDNSWLNKLERTYHVKLPQDLETLFGEQFVAAVSADNLVAPMPSIGIRSVTDPQAAADLSSRLQPVVDQLTAGLGVKFLPTDDGLVIATNSDYAQTLADGSGGILNNPAVTRAIDDPEDASMVGWLDMDVVGNAIGLTAPQYSDVVTPLEGIGIAWYPGDQAVNFRARVTFDE